MTRFSSETELAQIVMDWMTADGWDCYPEAQFYSGDKRADIAAVRGGLLHIVECKLSFSAEVIWQAQKWKGFAHWTSVAIPHTSRWSKGRNMFGAYCSWQGVGVIEVRKNAGFNHAYQDVYYLIQPKLDRAAHRTIKSLNLLDKLHPDMKNYAPGSCSERGQYTHSTPFRRTMKQVKRFIEANPGCSMKEIMDGLEMHHYASDKTARSCITSALTTFDAKGIRAERVGRSWKFYPKPMTFGEKVRDR